VPAFSFIQDGKFIINNYVLSKGQVIALRAILIKFADYFNQQIKQVDLINCNLNDENMKMMLQGLKQLNNIEEITL